MFDDAIAAQAAQEEQLRGGRSLDLSDWDMEAFGDPGYFDPVARIAAMDRDQVAAEGASTPRSQRSATSARFVVTGSPLAELSPTTSAISRR